MKAADRTGGSSRGDEPAGDEAYELGRRIRSVRRARHLTLKDAADAAGISESFLSQVERGLANPSVATLRRIADALQEHITSFFVGEAPGGMLVRKSARRRMAHPVGALEDFLLTPVSARNLQMIYSVIAPNEGSGDELYTHGGEEECVVVVTGRLRVTLESETFALGAGDSLLLDPGVPHGFLNPGSRPTTVIWAIAPPSF
jgi:transcriptional regulator with XRE-family HTH domain